LRPLEIRGTGAALEAAQDVARCAVDAIDPALGDGPAGCSLMALMQSVSDTEREQSNAQSDGGLVCQRITPYGPVDRE
jgi:hypothetical protein